MTSYDDDLLLFPDMWHKVGLSVWTLLLFFYPFVANANWLRIGNMVLVVAVGAIALMVLTGFTGQISLGHAAFLAIGAYSAAILGSHYGLPFWLILPASGVAAAAFGLLVGPFALRLEGLYLAILTLGLVFFVKHLLLSFPAWTGGVSGISVPVYSWFAGTSAKGLSPFTSPWQIGGMVLSFEQKLYFVFLLVTLITMWVAKNLQRSNLGRAMMAVRDHDLAAAVMGVHPAKVKIISFGISSFFAGVAGAMFGFQQQFITVNPTFGLELSIQYIAVIVLGGMGTVFGAVSGAIFFVMLTPLVEILGRQIPYLNTLSSAHQSIFLFSIVVCSFLLFEPLGLFGIWLRIKRYFMAWPFRY